MITPDRETYLQFAREYDIVPVARKVYADLTTPVSAFSILSKGATNAFLLESMSAGNALSRYSFLGVGDDKVVTARDHEVVVESGDEAAGVGRERVGDPLDVVERELGASRVAPVEGLPPFIGGAVGYVGYEYVTLIEPTVARVTGQTAAGPDLCFMYANVVVAFDNVHGTMQVIVPTRPGLAPSDAYDGALALISSVLERLDAGVREGSSVGLADVPKPVPVAFASHTSEKRYCEEVRLIKEHIVAGDAFQVVPSQRFSTPYVGDGLDVYRVMREVNPSPYMLYVRTREVTIVGASPESLVRVTGKDVLTRPLAGTRARGATRDEDERVAKELLDDEKERAEHVMLVDLARNDLGRVCTPGSVDVDELLSIERYSHVMHLSSNVVGTLAEDASAFDALRATFPAGTVSGAPKVRAMQLIAELEDEPRGPYAGAVGYFGLNGSMDMCIGIRCVVIADGQASVQVGAGVVADSNPESEYQETLKKAAAMRETLELVAGMVEGSVR